MFYELRLDADGVTFGGVWFNPETMEAIEVIDLDSAAGVDYANLMVKGVVYLSEERIRQGADARDWGVVERPPAPPALPEGPREWMPHSFYEKWMPEPKPGDLFWVPDVPLVERLVRSWANFEVVAKELSLREAWNFLSDEDKEGLVLAADAVIANDGMNSFMRPPGKRALVIKKTSEKAGDVDALTEEWHADQGIISSDPDKTIWKILKEWGIKKSR